MTDWCPSPMEKFLDLWTTSSTFWTSPDTEMMASTGTTTSSSRTTCPESRMDPNIALRSPQKRSGLFDNELADFSPKLHESVAQEDFHQQQTTTTTSPNQFETLAGDLDLEFPCQSDWMDLFGGDLESPLDNKQGDSGAVACDLFPFQEGSFDDIQEDLMENFTDLSNAILGAELSALTQAVSTEAAQEGISSTIDIAESMVIEPSTSSGPSSASGRRSVKRRATRRKTEEETVAVVPSEPLPVANHDHDDYTLKVKRQRYSTASMEESEGEDAVESSSADVGTTDKYVERRKKNNLASQRSRRSRKDKFQAMEEKVETLQQANKDLQEKVEMMESLAKALKQHLVTKLAK